MNVFELDGNRLSLYEALEWICETSCLYTHLFMNRLSQQVCSFHIAGLLGIHPSRLAQHLGPDHHPVLLQASGDAVLCSDRSLRVILQAGHAKPEIV